MGRDSFPHFLHHCSDNMHMCVLKSFEWLQKIDIIYIPSYYRYYLCPNQNILVPRDGTGQLALDKATLLSD